jgi:hypothetical protein
MSSLNTLFFPGTDIYSIRQYPIFLLFQKIHLIKPVENDPSGSGDESSDSFIKSGFCQVHTPCPLGENRERFLYLVNDIKNRKDDYSAQLSSLILAAKSNPSAGDEDSEREIITSLFTPNDQRAKLLQAEKEGKLWQARLVLAIGEILDKEEEEIARNLAVLEDDQAELFKALHGDMSDFGELEEDNPFAELSQLENNLAAANSGNIKKRFHGWKTLFFESNTQEFKECEIFLTTSRDGGDILLESYEKKTNLTALSAATLKLPGLIGWNSAEATAAVLAFHEKNEGLLSRIHGSLADLSRQKDVLNQEIKSNNTLAAMTEEWNTQLENFFPAKQFGRLPVKCYVFPGFTCSALTGKLPSETGEAVNGLLVVVG